MTFKAQIVICGAGIAGISAAYHLAQAGFKDILIVDSLPPLSLTSDRSTECYRNWWPDPAMVALMNRSIDIMEELARESGNVFRLNRRGYLYVTARPGNIDGLTQRARRIAESGAGPLRLHDGFASAYQPSSPPNGSGSPPTGADLLLDQGLIRRHYPYLTEQAVAALHVRRAGWLSAQQLGAHLLELGRHLGIKHLSAHVDRLDISGDRIRGVVLGSGERINCPIFVNAGGPYLKHIGAMLGVELPVQTELHLKISFRDQLGVVDRDAPLLIWDDPQFLPWDVSERAALMEEASTQSLTESFPPGAHVRPEGAGESRTILMLWDYKSRWMEPVFPPPLDDEYPEIALRGLSTMLPGLKQYFGRTPRPYVDGGYYVKTPENRLLAGPLPLEGAFVIGGLSGHGIMSSCAAGELLAAHVTGSGLPAYAGAFSLERYADPEYQAKLAAWDDTGQL